MEVSKLTICRQDVVVVSETEAQSQEEPGIIKKKWTSRLECVRKVHLTRMTVDRIVPNCYRPRCRHTHGHRTSSRNTRHTTRRDSLREKTQSETNMRDSSNAESQIVSSPITVESGSDTLEVISLCSFNPVSSDSDELEDLIKVTRQRMKNEEKFNNTKLFNRNSPGTSSQDLYKNKSSDVGVEINSTPPMGDLVINRNLATPCPPNSPENPNLLTSSKSQDNGVELLPNSNIVPDNEIALPKSVSPTRNRSLSPLYEISGKVFMEHYLNTCII